MSRLKLAGQGGALGLVAALLGLLIWKVDPERQRQRRDEVRAGKRPMAVDFNLDG